MPKQVLTGFAHPLLMQLEEAKRLAAKRKLERPMFVDRMLTKMERDVQFIDDILWRLERWKADLQQELSDIASILHDVLEDGDEAQGFEFKIQVVERKISGVKEDATPPVYLSPQVESEPSASSLAKTKTASTGFRDMTIIGRNPGIPLSTSYIWPKYEKMKPQLRACLLTLSVFPKVSVIKKRLLIHWWIGEGIVAPAFGAAAEKVGESCFQELIKQSLITPVHRAQGLLAVDRCTVPLWLRDELVYLSMLLEAFSFDSRGLPSPVLSGSPRVCLTEESSQEPHFSRQSIASVSSRFNPSRFLTCYNVNQHVLTFGSKEFMAMRKAAVVQLGKWQGSHKHHIEVRGTGFLEYLGCFKNLRYLSLRGISGITELPTAIGELYSLQILDLRACHDLEKLPDMVTKLSSLTHLDVSECCLLEHMPKGIGSLSELQVLKGFVIGGGKSKEQCQLRELAELEKLRKLSIKICNETLVSAEEFNELSKSRALRSLTLTWEILVMPTSNNINRGKPMTPVLVSPPPNLEKLDLRCFPRNAAPDWLVPGKLSNLKRLYVRGGRLQSLGRQCATADQTWSVEVLRLRLLTELDVEESGLLKAFPRLAYLEIRECNKLRNMACRLRT